MDTCKRISMNAIFTEKDRICREFQMKKFDVKKIVPVVTMQVEMNVEGLLSERQRINATSDVHVTIYSFLLKKIASALVKYPLLYSLYYKKRIITSERLILNIPVSIDNHVEYVFIQNPESKSVEEITVELQKGLLLIRQGKNRLMNALMEMDRLNGLQALLYKMRCFKNPCYFIEHFYGNFPVTNFGTFDVTQGIMVLSEPMVAGMVVGRIRPNAALENSHDKEPRCMTFSLAFDHRVMDGAYAGGFLNELKKEIEQL